MADDILTLDPDKLRALADRLERTTDELNGLRPPGLGATDLKGSDTDRAAGSEQLADLFDPILQALTRWALDARAAADAFEHMEKQNAAHLTGP